MDCLRVILLEFQILHQSIQIQSRCSVVNVSKVLRQSKNAEDWINIPNVTKGHLYILTFSEFMPVSHRWNEMKPILIEGGFYMFLIRTVFMDKRKIGRCVCDGVRI